MPATRDALLGPEFLAQLERLSLFSRRVFRGRVKGERRSPRRGHSVEFCDYRGYGAGDDLRYVDWNIYGRLDRLYVKLFVDEEELCLHLLLDASASMQFGAPTKLEYGARVAAALGFIGLVSMERVGVGVLRERVAEGWAPTRGRGHVVSLLEFLGRVEPDGGTRLNDGLQNYAMRSRDPGLAVVISDLLDPAGYETGVRALLERRFDVHLVHVLTPEELEPELAGDLRLVDSETGEVRELSVDGDAIRAYRRRLTEFLERAEAFCRAQEIGYHRVTTDTPVADFVLSRIRGRLLV
ncbi:MAG TPA: DUF58 domain-containing protein [Methylomirabilota bacterium]|jgi:uncharacterized protein (DUF58 family)|nr:DUF58 domain-containing protein [Methylomirabilota bacterium]